MPYSICFFVKFFVGKSPLSGNQRRPVRIFRVPNVRARHRDGIVIEHSGYQLHIITDIPPDTVVSELTRLFLDVFADPN